MTLRPVTSYEVATAADVSQSTVSRVFSNDPRVKPGTKRRVLEVAAKLGYRVNSAARMLATRSARTVGIVLHDLDYMTKVSFGGVVGGFAKAASYADYNIRFCCSDSASPVARNHYFVDNAREGLVDGLVVMDALVSEEVILQLDDIGVPFVLVDREVSDRCSVWNDHFGSAFLLAHHLADEGYSRIATIGAASGERLQITKARVDGLTLGCGGRAPKRLLISETKDSVTIEELARILTSNDRPDALVCRDCEIAVRLVCMAGALGIRVPEDLGIVSYEDDPMLSAAQPEITAPRFHWDTLGEIAGNMLIGLISGDDSQLPSAPLPASLIVRGSTNRSAPHTNPTSCLGIPDRLLPRVPSEKGEMEPDM